MNLSIVITTINKPNKSVKYISQEIKKNVQEATFQEKQDLEKAMERYYNKLNKVLSSETIQNKIIYSDMK